MEILDKNPNPTKDQHFMVDQEMLQLIYDNAEIKENESIVEIGGGEGALTDYLVQGNNYVTVIEKDPYYANYLKEKYKDYTNVQVVEGDALDFDFCSYDRVIANLPYTITEPFLANLACSGALNYNPADPKGSCVKKVTLVISQNSLRKMVAPIQIKEGNSRHANMEFGLMGTICKAMTDIEVVRSIPSSSFFPEPAVTSFLVNLSPKKQKTTVDRLLTEFLTDKKGNHATITRLYSLLLSQGKVYKLNKHKNTMMQKINPKFTSEAILNKNIYDLSNLHYSQLIQDLIKNDMSIKSKQHQTRDDSEKSYDDYLINGRFDFARYEMDQEENLDDNYEDEEEVFTKANKKHEQKYEYFYDDTKYKILENRGLEFLDQDNLYQVMNPGLTPINKIESVKR